MAWNLTTPYSQAQSGVLGTVVLIIIIVAVVLNILALYVFFRVKRPLRRPPNYFLAALAFVDLISAASWLLLALVAAITWRWPLNTHMCNLHSFLGYWGFSMNMHMYLAMMAEKSMKILFPSKHKDAFYSKIIVLIIIGSLSVFDTVISSLALMGWSDVLFFSYQMQCVTDYVYNVAHLNFYFFITYALPIVGVIIMAVAIAIKVKTLRQKIGPSSNEKFVLEEKKDVPKESFAERLKKQQASFQKAGMKRKKPKIGGKNKNKKNKKERDGSDVDYASETDSSASSHYESSTDDEDNYIRDYDDYKRMKQAEAESKKRKRVYTFRRSDLLMALTILICCAVYSVLWFGYWVITYLWVYQPADVSHNAYVFFTLLTFTGVAFKPLVYATNKQLRKAFLQAFYCCKRKKQPPPSGAPAQPAVSSTVVEKHYTYEETVTTTTTRKKEARPPPDLFQTDGGQQFKF